MRKRLTVDQYVDGVRAGERGVLARAITLVESRLPSDYQLAQDVLARLQPLVGGARRVGITGVPGVGKSTFIESLGLSLCERGHRLAVLAVDPSSSLSGGSLMGDKTRMARLAQHERAYIRPSPSGLSLGGVTRRTRETMMLCEAAGFDVVFVETVGVGQSETVVADMVDFFCVLMLPGAGDELQGIKKGILELADVIAVNKADGDNVARAKRSRAEYAAALGYTRTKHPDWKPESVCVSGLTGDGLEDLWAIVERHRQVLGESGGLDQLRAEQRRRWMWAMIEDRLLTAFREFRADALAEAERAVVAGSLNPTRAANELLGGFLGTVEGSDADEAEPARGPE